MKFQKIVDGQILLNDNGEEVSILIENIIRVDSSTDISKASYKSHQILMLVSAILFFPIGIYSTFFSSGGQQTLGFELIFVGFGVCFYVFQYIQDVRKNFDTDNHTITLVVKAMNAAYPMRIPVEIGDYESTQILKNQIIDLIKKDALKQK
jgi:hypothetical protein